MNFENIPILTLKTKKNGVVSIPSDETLQVSTMQTSNNQNINVLSPLIPSSIINTSSITTNDFITNVLTSNQIITNNLMTNTISANQNERNVIINSPLITNNSITNIGGISNSGGISSDNITVSDQLTANQATFNYLSVSNIKDITGNVTGNVTIVNPVLYFPSISLSTSNILSSYGYFNVSNIKLYYNNVDIGYSLNFSAIVIGTFVTIVFYPSTTAGTIPEGTSSPSTFITGFNPTLTIFPTSLNPVGLPYPSTTTLINIGGSVITSTVVFSSQSVTTGSLTTGLQTIQYTFLTFYDSGGGTISLPSTISSNSLNFSIPYSFSISYFL